VKRGDLLRHLRQHGCNLKREGGSHSLWTNPRTGAVEAIPRHNEISDQLARRSAAILEFPRLVARAHAPSNNRTQRTDAAQAKGARR
jgi:mRNA interferase HicA